MEQDEPKYTVTVTYNGAIEKEESFGTYDDAMDSYDIECDECEHNNCFNSDWVVSLYDNFSNREIERKSGETE